MERQDPECSYPAIEVLDGQTSVEELLADLGFEWRVESSGPGTAGEPFSQPALF